MFGKELPIFDSLTHPTLSGKWQGKNRFNSSSFVDLGISLSKSNVCSAVASTFPSNESISPEHFIEECMKITRSLGINIYPAYIVRDSDQLFDFILPSIQSLSQKYRFIPIIKLNSCFIDFSNLQSVQLLLEEIIGRLQSNCILYVCTYPYSTLTKPQLVEIRPFVDFLSQQYSHIPIVLLHGGTAQLLEMSQYAQHFENIYLDLSFTICRYINSSLFFDFCYMFEYLDQKIVVGTDHPEYTYLDLRQAICRIENHLRLQTNVTNKTLKHKLSNIMFKNMMNLISDE